MEDEENYKMRAFDRYINFPKDNVGEIPEPTPRNVLKELLDSLEIMEGLNMANPIRQGLDMFFVPHGIEGQVKRVERALTKLDNP